LSADEDIKPQLTPEGKFALLLIACEFATFVVFLLFNEPGVGLSACISVAVLMIAIRATWRLHVHRWYWVATAVSIALQAPFLVYVPWSNHAFRGTALLPFGLLDFILVWGCIKLAEKLMKKSDEASSPK
jgi:hypothetical protein